MKIMQFWETFDVFHNFVYELFKESGTSMIYLELFKSVGIP